MKNYDLRDIKSVAVYAASSTQVSQQFIKAAVRLGEALAGAGMRLVYGAGKVGLMGAVADSVLRHGGKVTGVIPEFMVREGWCKDDCTELIVTQTMHERKARICEMADAMVALPGGIGTFEELTECLTWKQLGLHVKPVVIVNTNGYYDGLLSCFDKMVAERLMRDVHKKMYVVVERGEDVLSGIEECERWSTEVRKQAQV